MEDGKEINDIRCYNNPTTGKGEWVTVSKCDNNGNDGYCALSDDTVVLRKNISYYTGCMDDGETINDKRCYNNPITGKGEWVTVKVCDKNGNNGYCAISDEGPVVPRKYISLSSGCTTDSKTTPNVTDNPQTGRTAIIIAWVVAVIALIISFAYFKQNNDNKNTNNEG